MRKVELNKIYNQDCLEGMRQLEENSIDALISDPPYQLSATGRGGPDQTKEGSYGKEVPFSRQQSRIPTTGFMGKNWDVLPTQEILTECLRVLKPGAWAMWCMTPRQDSYGIFLSRLSEAGFNIGFSGLTWAYASGFPKALNIEKNISKLIDRFISFDVNTISWKLSSAKSVEKLLKRSLTEAGIPTNLKDFVVGDVPILEGERPELSNANTVAKNSKDRQATSEGLFIVVDYADTIIQDTSISVHIATNLLSSHNQKFVGLNIIVPSSVLITECESILSKIKGGGVLKIELGSVRSLKEQDISAFYVELIESWRHIISNHLINSQNLDMNSLTECASAITVITTKSIMECLISSTVSILGRKLKEENKKFEGAYGGMQLKPAVELIVVSMKGMTEKSYIDQAMKTGKGITWLDNCRIPYQSEADKDMAGEHASYSPQETIFELGLNARESAPSTFKGRFPANLLVSDGVLDTGLITQWKREGPRKNTNHGLFDTIIGTNGIIEAPGDSGDFSRYFSLDSWFDEKMKELPKEVRRTFPFLIEPKAAKGERNEGLANMPDRYDVGVYGDGIRNVPKEDGQRPNPYKNVHPSVKPISLMSYLITLTTKPREIVLDPFMGSGTTAIAAHMMNRQFIGYEKEPDYHKIATERIAHYLKQCKLGVIID